jgi:hypothetical protein
MANLDLRISKVPVKLLPSESTPIRLLLYKLDDVHQHNIPSVPLPDDELHILRFLLIECIATKSWERQDRPVYNTTYLHPRENEKDDA